MLFVASIACRGKVRVWQFRFELVRKQREKQGIVLRVSSFCRD